MPTLNKNKGRVRNLEQFEEEELSGMAVLREMGAKESETKRLAPGE